ncbi:MAG: ABC transporter ATP-binding protein, partial [Clostridia bacterium]|nr:ABC transporter ATP-binding protein [Clostridia bacterium]
MKNAKNKTSRRETWKRLLAYIRKSLPLLALTIVFAGATVGLSLYIPILCGRAIDCMTGTGTVDFDGIARCLVKIGICASLCGILQWVMNSLNNRVAYRVIRDVRRDAFDTLTHLPLSYIDSHPHGGTVSRVIADVDQFADGLLLGFTQFFTGIATIVCTLVFMLMIHPLITLAVVVLTPLSLFVAAFIARRTYSMF